jgi:preprotein translocase subunit SecD
MTFHKKLGSYLIKSLFISSVVTLSLHVLAEEMSSADKEALQKTMQLLQNPNERQEVINSSSDANKADQMAKQLVGEENLQDVYRLAAQVMRKLAIENKGDSQSMVKEMQQAQKNPEAFYNSLSDGQRKEIMEMRRKIKERNEQLEKLNDSAQP